MNQSPSTNPTTQNSSSTQDQELSSITPSTPTPSSTPPPTQDSIENLKNNFIGDKLVTQALNKFNDLNNRLNEKINEGDSFARKASNSISSILTTLKKAKIYNSKIVVNIVNTLSQLINNRPKDESGQKAFQEQISNLIKFINEQTLTDTDGNPINITLQNTINNSNPQQTGGKHKRTSKKHYLSKKHNKTKKSKMRKYKGGYIADFTKKNKELMLKLKKKMSSSSRNRYNFKSSSSKRGSKSNKLV